MPRIPLALIFVLAGVLAGPARAALHAQPPQAQPADPQPSGARPSAGQWQFADEEEQTPGWGETVN